jgi:peptidyl-prolyl cis-trans isomerase A (cyclophilin A)
MSIRRFQLFSATALSSILLVAACSSSDDDDAKNGANPGAAGAGGSSGGGGSAGGAAGDTGEAGGAGGDAAGGGGEAGAAGAGGETVCGPDGEVTEEVLTGTTDPEAGDFTIEEALAELPEGPGPLRAIIETEMGTLHCELFPDDAPIGVANFVGLARGKRPFKDVKTKKWVKRRFYDGLVFHRVIPEFMAQGGDPLGTGTGGPGYEFVNEVSSRKHEPGTLAYANSGPDTNGSQFYVTEIKTDWLDGDYTVFGQCDADSVTVVTAMTHVPTGTTTATKEKPVTPIHTTKVTITRCAP